MTLPIHRLPAGDFSALARGGGGTRTVGRLAATRASLTRLCIELLPTLTARNGHPDAPAVADAYRVLAGLEREYPHGVGEVLGHPAVSSWAVGTAERLLGPRDRAGYPGMLGAVAAAAAVRVGAGVEVEVAVPAGGPLVLPSLGSAAVPAGVARVRVRCAGGGAEVTVPGYPTVRCAVGDRRWHPVPRLEVERGGMRLAVELGDAAWSPWAVHSGNKGLDIDDSHIDVGAWFRRLSAGWNVLVDGHRTVAEEVARAVTTIIPLRRPVAGVVSGTFHNAFGAVAMSLPDEHRLLALTLAHEIQHTKLSALMDLLPLVRPGGDERYYAPWRPDPRPLSGLFHGAYAHLGVAGFWRRQRHRETDPRERYRADVEFSRWTAATYEVTAVLAAQDRLTPPGRRFVATMRAVLDRWRREPVPADAARTAGHLLREHRPETGDDQLPV